MSERKRIHKLIPFTEDWFYLKWTYLRRGAKERNIEFFLTLQDYKDILNQSTCFYCEKICNPVPREMSIDRVDNSGGYSISNCVLAHRKCNQIKGDLNASDIKMLEKIIEVLKKQPPRTLP